MKALYLKKCFEILTEGGGLTRTLQTSKMVTFQKLSISDVYGGFSYVVVVLEKD